MLSYVQANLLVNDTAKQPKLMCGSLLAVKAVLAGESCGVGLSTGICGILFDTRKAI
ncbi:hypothetical protein SLEP1_g2305 [Rubroshorea leprosula]|uniref:Uncharacterized protein n=1 Tax=Rubroshorea leprosula TaxID=152421 RepID=A0AAV5HL46_9ROSI|nr:hypothetical protein SLEP1_g2305 [Rubroshorea leprosula]